SVRWSLPLSAAGLCRSQHSVFRLGQLVNDSLPLQMPCQSLPTASFLARPFCRRRPCSRIAIQVIIVLASSGFAIRTPRLSGRLEQCQLLFRQLLTLAVALRFKQFAHQTLIFVLLGQGTIQLFGQSTTILRSVSASRGKLFGSIGTVHLAYAQTG